MSQPRWPKPIKQLLGYHQFAKYLDKSTELRQLAHVLNMCLEPSVQPYIHLRNWRNGELILGLANHALMTRLRYQLPELTKTLQSHPEFQSLKKIRLRINMPETTATKSTMRKPTPINQQNCRLLQETAQTIKHPQLQQALEKLAKNHS